MYDAVIVGRVGGFACVVKFEREVVEKVSFLVSMSYRLASLSLQCLGSLRTRE